ncbi:MAG: ABC transporter substrate-binding protein [Bacillota bacterium]|jgi:iron complex transport system substrate-binding protein
MKKFITVMLALGLLLALTACGNAENGGGEQAADQASITVTDHNGNEITLPAEIDKIAVADILPLPSVLSVFFDSADRIVGISPISMAAAENGLLGELYPEILEADTGWIEGTSVNVEELMKLEPDVVFYSAESPDVGQTLNDAGFNAVAVSAAKWEYDCIETLNNWVALLSQIFPENDKTQTVADYSNEIYDMVQGRVADIPDAEREKVFYLFNYDDTNLTTSGKLFFGQWWADAVGAENVAEELTTDNSAAVNMEQIYSWNPQMVFITNFNAAQPADLYNNTMGNYDWSEIDAVKNQQVYKMPLGAYRSYTPGADTPMTLLWMAKTVYPDLFEDIDLNQEVKNYYQEVFGIELSDEQIEKYFNPSSAVGENFNL